MTIPQQLALEFEKVIMLMVAYCGIAAIIGIVAGMVADYRERHRVAIIMDGFVRKMTENRKINHQYSQKTSHMRCVYCDNNLPWDTDHFPDRIYTQCGECIKQ